MPAESVPDCRLICVQAGTAGGALITAQRIGAAIGIAVIGTVLSGSGSGRVVPG